LKIVFDATAVVRQQAGVGRFARGLLSGLAAVDTHNEYVLVTTGKARVVPTDAELPIHHQWLRLPISERLATMAWQRLRLRPSPVDLVRGADFLITPDYALPRVGRIPSAVTVHDLSFLLFPECADANLRRYLERIVPRSIEQASVIFAVSHTTALALTSQLGVRPERIAVVANAVDARFRPAGEAERPAIARNLQQTFGLESGYLLTVGTLEPRKNLVRLLKAYSELRRVWSVRSGGERCPTLVIVGREGWRFEPIFRECARLGLGKAVRFFTRVQDAELLSFYWGARAFVCASLYEGFGIPPLEAMACGIPVASTTGGALGEVLGDAALPFGAEDIEGMRDALETILLDEDVRERLSLAGARRRAAYSWAGSAETALAAIEGVAA
jgi:glycosyltransferase involved in cell wall biosynthesis